MMVSNSTNIQLSSSGATRALPKTFLRQVFAKLINHSHITLNHVALLQIDCQESLYFLTPCNLF